MTEQWGAPLIGAQMKLLRAAGMADGTQVRLCGTSCVVEELTLDSFFPDYELPADHIAYTLLNAGWLDGRNVRLWFGGDKAPDDWDGEKVLCDAGFGEAFPPNLDWVHGEDGIVPIIAYIAKDDAMESDDPGTVTIAKMTEAEIIASWQDSAGSLLHFAGKLGLIKEATREERFWALHEPEGTTVPTHIKKWVKDALEFER